MSISELFKGKTAGRHVTSNGEEEWYDDNEELHRDGDLPARTDSRGGKAWFKHGKLHREGDKPAIEAANGDRAWYCDGVLHRDHGPAIIYADKNKEPEYWLAGRPMTDAERAQRDADFAAARAAAAGEAVKGEINNGTAQKVVPLKPIHFKR